MWGERKISAPIPSIDLPVARSRRTSSSRLVSHGACSLAVRLVSQSQRGTGNTQRRGTKGVKAIKCVDQLGAIYGESQTYLVIIEPALQ